MRKIPPEVAPPPGKIFRPAGVSGQPRAPTDSCQSLALALGLIGGAVPELYRIVFTLVLFSWRRTAALQRADCDGTPRCKTRPSPIRAQSCD